MSNLQKYNFLLTCLKVFSRGCGRICQPAIQLWHNRHRCTALFHLPHFQASTLFVEKKSLTLLQLDRPLDDSLGIGRLLKLAAITLTTAAVIHKAEKNKAGRSSQKAPFPPTGNYFFQSPGASASQTTES